MIGDLRVAGRAEEDRVGRCEPIEPVVGHHRALLDVPFRPPVVGGSFQRDAVALRDDVEHSHCCVGDFGTDTVPRNHGYVVCDQSTVSRVRL